MDDFNYALDRVIGGLEKKNKIISPEEKEIIAYPRSRSCYLRMVFRTCFTIGKGYYCSKRNWHIGYAQYLPKEEYITRTEQLLDRMCMTFGGRAAEKIMFDKISHWCPK